MTGRTFHRPAGVMIAGAILALWPCPVDAQLAGGGGSLGGYGASTGSVGNGMAGSGTMIVPYSGRSEGFMPGRMGGGASLSFQTRPVSPMSVARASSVFSSFSGGMSSGTGRMGRGLGSRPSMSNPLIPRVIGAGGSSFRLGSGGGGLSVMPPSISYPFRQPTFPSSSSGGAGSSM